MKKNWSITEGATRILGIRDWKRWAEEVLAEGHDSMHPWHIVFSPSYDDICLLVYLSLPVLSKDGITHPVLWLNTTLNFCRLWKEPWDCLWLCNVWLCHGRRSCAFGSWRRWRTFPVAWGEMHDFSGSALLMLTFNTLLVTPSPFTQCATQIAICRLQILFQ